MENTKLIILSRKTKYFLIYIYYNLYIFLYGIKLNQNQLNIIYITKKFIIYINFFKI